MRAANFPDRKLTVDEFLEWVETDPEAEFVFEDGTRRHKCDVRFELYEGAVTAMSPERAGHAEAKFNAAMTLRSAIEANNLPCKTWINGLGVRIDDGTLYEPDALVRCGDRLGGDAQEVSDPVIIVEILSPSTRSKDIGEKMEAYLSLPSLHHYLIVDAGKRKVIHYHRDQGEVEFRIRIVSSGPITLDPPGIKIALEDILPPPDLGDEEASR